jgi:antitoxin VapB
MPLTRAFKSGNSQAVRIPADLAYDDLNLDLSITRHGDVIVIAPARPSFKEVIALLRTTPKPSEAEVYEPIELPDRAAACGAACRLLRAGGVLNLSRWSASPTTALENWMAAI